LKGADTMVLAPLTQFQIGDNALHDGNEDTGCTQSSIDIGIGKTNACYKTNDSGNDDEGNIKFVIHGSVFDMRHLMKNGIDLGVISILFQKLFELGIVVNVSMKGLDFQGDIIGLFLAHSTFLLIFFEWG